MSLADRDRLKAFLAAIGGSRTALKRRRDDWRIVGRNGDVWSSNGSYLLYLGPSELRNRIKPQFGEGRFRLDRLPTDAEGAIIREALGVRKRPPPIPMVATAAEAKRGRIVTCGLNDRP